MDVSKSKAFLEGEPVDVVSRLSGGWTSGFEIDSVTRAGCRVRRISDGTVLPVMFRFDEVRHSYPTPERPAAVAGIRSGCERASVMVRLPATLDIATVEAIRTLVMDSVEDAGDEVVLDLSAVRFLDTYGIRLLVMIRRRAWERELRVRVEGANPLVQALLDLVAIDPAHHPDLTTATPE
jgi:anti-anti-sigma factor